MSCNPLTRCANLRCFLFLFGFCYFLETITYTYLASAIQSIERQFQLPSRLSGSLVAAGDIGYIITVVVLAYYGAKSGNRARWIGAGCVLIAIACLIVALPTFIFPSRPSVSSNLELTKGLNEPLTEKQKLLDLTEFNITTNNRETLEASQEPVKSTVTPFALCHNESTLDRSTMMNEKCKPRGGSAGNNAAFAIVFIGIALIGVGHSMPWTLGLPMIDDHVKKRKTPYYLAGIYFVRVMGPIAGFMLGAICSKMYVDLKAPPGGISPLDPRWIGAWWLGFVIVALMLTVPSILLTFLPKFRTEDTTKSVTVSYSANSRTPLEVKDGEQDLVLVEQSAVVGFNESKNETAQRKSVREEIRDFGRTMAQIMRSPVYTGSLIGRMFDSFAIKGYFTFKPKYLQNHYGVTQFKGSMVMAVQIALGFCIGVVLGSYLMRKARLEGRKAVFFSAVSTLLVTILAFAQIFLGCYSVVNQVGRIGVENNNGSTPVWPSVPGCDCESSDLFPVCSRNGTPYYSPCHAGCTNFTFAQDFRFNQCSAIHDDIGEASREWCQDDCHVPFILHVVLGCVAGIIAGCSVVPNVLIAMRCVATEYRSVALGFLGFAVSLMSTFPSPPVYGLIIDTACVKWNTACDGSTGSCQIYDPTKLRNRLYLFHGLLRVGSFLADLWVWYAAKDLKLMEERGKEKIEEEKNETTGEENNERGEERKIEGREQKRNEKLESIKKPRPSLPLSPSFAREIEVEVKGIHAVENSDVLDGKMTM